MGNKNSHVPVLRDGGPMETSSTADQHQNGIFSRIVHSYWPNSSPPNGSRLGVILLSRHKETLKEMLSKMRPKMDALASEANSVTIEGIEQGDNRLVLYAETLQHDDERNEFVNKFQKQLVECKQQILAVQREQLELGQQVESKLRQQMETCTQQLYVLNQRGIKTMKKQQLQTIVQQLLLVMEKEIEEDAERNANMQQRYENTTENVKSILCKQLETIKQWEEKQTEINQLLDTDDNLKTNQMSLTRLEDKVSSSQNSSSSHNASDTNIINLPSTDDVPINTENTLAKFLVANHQLNKPIHHGFLRDNGRFSCNLIKTHYYNGPIAREDSLEIGPDVLSEFVMFQLSQSNGIGCRSNQTYGVKNVSNLLTLEEIFPEIKINGIDAYCVLCKLNVSSSCADICVHVQERNHRNNLQLIQESSSGTIRKCIPSRQVSPSVSSNVPKTVNTVTSKEFCNVCQVSYPSGSANALIHIKGKKHKSMLMLKDSSQSIALQRSDPKRNDCILVPNSNPNKSSTSSVTAVVTNNSQNKEKLKTCHECNLVHPGSHAKLPVHLNTSNRPMSKDSIKPFVVQKIDNKSKRENLNVKPVVCSTVGLPIQQLEATGSAVVPDIPRVIVDTKFCDVCSVSYPGDAINVKKHLTARSHQLNLESFLESNTCTTIQGYENESYCFACTTYFLSGKYNYDRHISEEKHRKALAVWLKKEKSALSHATRYADYLMRAKRQFPNTSKQRIDEVPCAVCNINVKGSLKMHNKGTKHLLAVAKANLL